jgi:hypothetical protein
MFQSQKSTVMKKLFAVLISVQLAGCGTVEFLTKDPRHTTYDVCHKQPHQCKVMPNWTNEALIRQARGETW